MSRTKTYNVGDRVRYFGNEHTSPDVGTVTSIEDDGTVWARWDSDNELNYFYSFSERFENVSDADLEARVARLEELVQFLLAKQAGA